MKQSLQSVKSEQDEVKAEVEDMLESLGEGGKVKVTQGRNTGLVVYIYCLICLD